MNESAPAYNPTDYSTDFFYSSKPMKTIRLLYPDWISGGLETYHFGANLLQHILPVNPNQPLVKVDIPAPDGRQREIQDGIAGKDEVLAGIRAAQAAIENEAPERFRRRTHDNGTTCFNPASCCR